MKYYEIEMLYLENISKEDLLTCLHSCTDVKEYFVILHDKDIWSEDVLRDNEIVYHKGDLKKPHFHCYIGFEDYGRNTFKKFCDTFSPLSNSFKPIKNIDSAIKYGLHLGYSDKYQYNRNEYLTNNLERLDRVLSTCKIDIEDVLLQFYDNINNLKITDNETMVNFFKEKHQLTYLISHYTYLSKFLDNSLYDIVDFRPIENRYNYERRKN